MNLCGSDLDMLPSTTVDQRALFRDEGGACPRNEEHLMPNAARPSAARHQAGFREGHTFGSSGDLPPSSLSLVLEGVQHHTVHLQPAEAASEEV